MLLLKKHLVELVRSGKKRQTIRYWTRPIVSPGQISFTPGLGKMKILSVEELTGYQELTLEDALADGFTSLPELLAELKRNYPQIPPGKRLYRVVFQWPVSLTSTPTPAVVRSNAAELQKVGQAPINQDVSKKSALPALRGESDSDQGLTGSESTAKFEPDYGEGKCEHGGMHRWQKEQLRDWIMAKSPHHS